MIDFAKRALQEQLVRYLIAGGSAFAMEYVAFFVFYTLLSWPLYVSNSISFCVGLVVSFVLNRTWAFRKDNFDMHHHKQLVMYVCLALFNLVLTNVIIGVLHGIMPVLVAKLGAMLCIVVWNFFIFRFFIFAGTKAE